MNTKKFNKSPKHIREITPNFDKKSNFKMLFSNLPWDKVFKIAIISLLIGGTCFAGYKYFEWNDKKWKKFILESPEYQQRQHLEQFFQEWEGRRK